jgi:hypothetical protein
MASKKKQPAQLLFERLISLPIEEQQTFVGICYDAPAENAVKNAIKAGAEGIRNAKIATAEKVAKLYIQEYQPLVAEVMEARQKSPKGKSKKPTYKSEVFRLRMVPNRQGKLPSAEEIVRHHRDALEKLARRRITVGSVERMLGRGRKAGQVL